MTTYAQQKGQRGHQLTEEWLKNFGWSTWTKPHQQTTFRGKGYEWCHTGSNDIYSIPKPGNPKKRHGGFDILALRRDEYTLWQVKKTKANPITTSLKKLIRECADYYNLQYDRCYIIWWPNGTGIKKGGCVTWSADQD